MAFKPLLNQSQTDLLLSHFRSKGSISGIEAQALYRIRSLSRRINDLEEQGYVFARSNGKDPTGQRYVRYHYLGWHPAESSSHLGHFKEAV